MGTDGIYVLVLDSILDQLEEINFPPKDVSMQISARSSEHEPPWPNLRLREVRFDGVEVSGRRVPYLCMALTETKLYFSIVPDDIADELGENMWCYDFARSSLPM